MSFAALGRFGDLLRVAGAASAHWGNQRDRAIAVRQVDEIGEEWSADLPGWKSELTGALAQTVRALAAAPAAEIRKPIALALGQLVTAARTIPPSPSSPAPVTEKRWWTDAER